VLKGWLAWAVNSLLIFGRYPRPCRDDSGDFLSIEPGGWIQPRFDEPFPPLEQFEFLNGKPLIRFGNAFYSEERPYTISLGIYGMLLVISQECLPDLLESQLFISFLRHFC
jgi:hypothetical protein